MVSYKIILTIAWLVILLFETSAFSQVRTKRTDVEERELSGAVHEVHFSRKLIMTLDKAKEFGGGWLPGLMVFNRDGFLEKSEAFNDEGEFLYKIVCRFNASGQKIEEIETDIAGERTRKRTFSYDDNGNLTEMTDYNVKEDKPGSVYRPTYDDKGVETGDIGLDKEGNINRIARISRSSYGETTDFYNSKGEFLSRESKILSRDDTQQKEEIINFDENNQLSSRFVTTTDEKGNITEVEYNSKGEIVEKIVYLYQRDKQGNWTKETASEWLNKNGKLILNKKTEINRLITYF